MSDVAGLIRCEMDGVERGYADRRGELLFQALDQIERLRSLNDHYLAALNEIAAGNTPAEQHGHYLAHRNAIRVAREAVRYGARPCV